MNQEALKSECQRMQERIIELESLEEENMCLKGQVDLANIIISKLQNQVDIFNSVSLFMDELEAASDAQGWLEQIANNYPNCDKNVSYLDEISSDNKVYMLTIDDYGDVPVALAILNRNDSNKTTLRKVKFAEKKFALV